jgi:hypothetical protein
MSVRDIIAVNAAEVLTIEGLAAGTAFGAVSQRTGLSPPSLGSLISVAAIMSARC